MSREKRYKAALEKWARWMRCGCTGCCWRQQEAIEATGELIESGLLLDLPQAEDYDVDETAT